MSALHFRIGGYDLGAAHLGCACLEFSADRGIVLVARHTIHVGELVTLPEPITRTVKSTGRTWVQTHHRVTGPEAFERAAVEACAWGLALGIDVAALEWIKDLHAGSHSPVLHAGQVGQALHGELRRAGVAVELYGRATALALVRRLAVARGAPVLPAVVKSRGAELGPVLDALVVGWAGTGPVVGGRKKREEATNGRDQEQAERALSGENRGPVDVPPEATGSDPVCDEEQRVESDHGCAPSVQDRAPTPAGSREDRRPEHETDACAVAVAHVAAMAGITVAPAVKEARATRVAGGAGEGARVTLAKKGRPRGQGRGRKPAEGCKACPRGIAPGPTHRKGCVQWRKWSA